MQQRKAIWAATVTALAVGLPMGRTQAGKAIVRPLVNFFFPLPKIALLPLIIIALGLGEASQIVLVWLVIVFYCTTSLADAAASISPEYYQPLLVQGRSRRELLLHVTLPAVIPELLSAVKTSAGAKPRKSCVRIGDRRGSLGSASSVRYCFMKKSSVSAVSGHASAKSCMDGVSLMRSTAG